MTLAFAVWSPPRRQSRDANPRYLEERWERAQAGHGSLVHIKAAVGAGKSSILNQFIETVRNSDEQAVVVSADCGDRAMVRSSDRRRTQRPRGANRRGVKSSMWTYPMRKLKPKPVQWLLPGVDFLTAATRLAALPSTDASETGPSRANIHADLLLDIAVIIQYFWSLATSIEPTKRLKNSSMP